mgnify:CR=1 FL=1
MGCANSVVENAATYSETHETAAQVPTEVGIPVKVGEPLSTACDRANVVGSIPRVIRYAGFTLVDDGAISSVPSNGGIADAKLVSFFNNEYGCYKGNNSRLASTCC